MNNNLKELTAIISKLLSVRKGLLAADESNRTISKRFAAVQLESTPENRRAYRELLLTTPEIEQFLSGVILFDETIRQKMSNGLSFIEYLKKRDIVPGIKVDKGTKEIPFFKNETITEGLDGLENRLEEYSSMGLKFTKWRALFQVSESTPSRECIKINATQLAQFAALSQSYNMVPIIEPEVDMKGSHTVEQCELATERVLHAVIDSLWEQKVNLETLIVKANMVLPGLKSNQVISVADIASYTVRCLKKTLVPIIPGIVFLSGGQTSQDATKHLNAINNLGQQPWRLTFSFSRAIQEPVLSAWRGKSEQTKSAQSIMLHRVHCASAASMGGYTNAMEGEVGGTGGI